MGDAMDRIQQHELEERERQISDARQSVPAPSNFICEECDTPISPARRMAIQGVTHCVFCQQKREMQRKHYRRQP
jgi:phage/conjugal plasmid C-4 type zinc finger TraR family protein